MRRVVTRGFTLVELLVVITIIGLTTAATISGVIYAMRDRAVVAGADLLRAAVDGARTASQRGPGRGIRLLPDPALVSRLASGAIDPARALASSRWVELLTPPDYTTGRVSIYPGAAYSAAVTGGRPCLVIEESPGHWVQGSGGWIYEPNEPTAWWGLARLGERVRLGAQGYTVCGPYVAANEEGATNIGSPATPSPLTRTLTAPDGVTTVAITPQYLQLVNNRDDDGDGFVDNGWDGLDNDLVNGTDDVGEWELESWAEAQARQAEDQAYRLERRPAPTGLPQALPSAAVVDLTGWAVSPSARSQAPVDPLTGSVDLVLGPDGRAALTGPYGAPSARGLRSAWVHLWVADRGDVKDDLGGTGGGARLVSVSPSGRISVTDAALESPHHAAETGE